MTAEGRSTAQENQTAPSLGVGSIEQRIAAAVRKAMYDDWSIGADEIEAVDAIAAAIQAELQLTEERSVPLNGPDSWTQQTRFVTPWRADD